MHLDDMTAWRRLGKLVAARRAELRLNQGDLKDKGGPSLPSVQSIEGARQDTYRDRTLMDLERALGWERGSVETVLFSGGDPVVIEPVRPTVPTGDSPVIAAILNDPHLLPEAKEHLKRQYGLLLRVQAETKPVREFVQQGQSDLMESGLHLVDDENRQ